MDQDIHEHPNPAYLSVRKSYLLVLGDALESLESAVEYGEPRSLEELSACRALRDAVAPLAARRARAQRIAALEAGAPSSAPTTDPSRSPKTQETAMTQIESLPQPALERVASALVAWLATETRLTLGFEPMRAVVGALPAYRLTQTRREWNGMGSDVEEDVLAAGTLEDVSSVVFRIVNRFNHGMRL